MFTVKLYFWALVLYGLGALLGYHTSPFSRIGGAKLERRKKRKVAGMICLIAATLLLGIAILSQFVSK